MLTVNTGKNKMAEGKRELFQLDSIIEENLD